MKTATARQQKIAAAYDADIWPLVPQRGAEAILRQLPRLVGAQVWDVGSATGKLALDLAARLDDASRVIGTDPSPALVALAEEARRAHPTAATAARVSFQVSDAFPPAPPSSEGRGYDLVSSNLALGDAADPQAAVTAMAGALKPGGRLIATVPLRGCWSEFLDLYGDVLTEQGMRPGLAALQAYRASLPDALTAVKWLEKAGLKTVAVDTDRWQLLFKSAREFFFAPVVELGPLTTWKQLAGGRGEEMQDLFFFVKEAIETYFAGGVFSVTMVVGCLRGTKPAEGGAPPARSGAR